MFFSAIGIVLVFAVLLSARARQVKELTGRWRMALYGALGVLFCGYMADSLFSGIFHWYGTVGLLLAVGGDVAWVGGAMCLVIWFGLRAAMRFRYENSEGSATAAMGRAGSRLDILMIVIAGLILSELVPKFLGGLNAMRLDLTAPPVTQQVKFQMMHTYEKKDRRWSSKRRDAVFLRENGKELTIPMPVKDTFDEQEPLSAVTGVKTGTPMEIVYYPHSKVIVSVRTL